MSDEFTIKDYWYFIKKHVITIVVTMCVLLVIFFSWVFISNSQSLDVNRPLPNQETVIEEFDKEIIAELMQSDFSLLNETEQNLLMTFLKVDSYSFNFVVETASVESFTDYRLLKEILTSEPIVNIIELNTGLEITPDAKRGVILNEEYGGVISLKVGVGDKNSNRIISQAYYELLGSDTLEFFENKKVYFLSAQANIDEVIEENDRMPEDIERQNSPINQIETYIVLGILTIIGGLFLGVAVSLIKGFLSDKISHLFDYNLGRNDSLVKFNDYTSNKNDLSYLLANSVGNKKIILSDSKKLTEFTAGFLKVDFPEKEFIFSNQLSEIKPDINYAEVIILVEVYETSKKWYKNQRILANNIGIPVKIIQCSE